MVGTANREVEREGNAGKRRQCLIPSELQFPRKLAVAFFQVRIAYHELEINSRTAEVTSSLTQEEVSLQTMIVLYYGGCYLILQGSCSKHTVRDRVPLTLCCTGGIMGSHEHRHDMPSVRLENPFNHNDGVHVSFHVFNPFLNSCRP